MQRKDNSIVNIDYDIKKGLIFKWNFKGYLSSIYYRHIMFLDVDEKSPLSDFIESYYSKIKSGDLITFGFISNSQEFLFSGLKEKNPLTQIQNSRIKPTVSTLQNLIEFISEVDQQQEQYEEPVIIGVSSQRSYNQLMEIQNHLTQLVQRNTNYTANLFCNARTSINVTTGVNVLNLHDMAKNDGWTFFKSHLAQIALLRVKIIIECENGCISSQKKLEWKSVDFNRIERELRMPTVNYLEDIVEFVNENFKDEINYLLNIRLEYEELSRKCYQAQKSISIKLDRQKLYPKSMAYQRQTDDNYEITPDLISVNNPYESKTIVWFVKDLLQDQQLLSQY